MSKKLPFELQENEVLYLDPTRVIIIRGAMKVKQGTLSVTNQRLVLSESSMMWGAAFGLIGALIAGAAKGTPTVIEPSSITEAKRIKQGINNQFLQLTFSNGDVMKLNVKPHIEKITEALNKLQINVLPLEQ